MKSLVWQAEQMPKAPYSMLLAIQLASVAAFLAGLLSLELFYYLGMLWLAILIWFAYRGIFPFNSQGEVISKTSWYSSWAISVLGLVFLANSGEPLFWFPTDHSVWMLVPYLTLGAIAWKLRLAMKPAD